MTTNAGENDVAQKNTQKIKVTPYSAPSQNPIENSPTLADLESSQTGKPWWYSQFNLMLVVFALLGLAVLSFITLTPSPVANLAETPTNAQPNTKLALTTTEQESPWDDARRAQARTDAQEILSNLLDSKKFLEDKEVKTWAPIEFEQALLSADQGDEAYKLQDYQQALETYQSAVDSLDELYEKIPLYVKAKIEQGMQAIDEGKSQLAHDSFTQALAIEPDNLAALAGLSRAKILDQVLQLSQAADLDKQLFLEEDELPSLLSAQQKLQEAYSLDQKNKNLLTQLDEVDILHKDKQYRDAMTKGFAALFVSKFSTASKAFAVALKLNPDDKTASLAYQQALAANKTSSLQGLLNRATQFETSEDWQNALSNYQAVLSRDSNQVQAKLGQIRSQARYQLDLQIRKTLDDPLSLSKAAQKKQAQQLLKDAQSTRSPGSKLTAQIKQLKAALNATDASIKIRISSDSLTDITLSKEGSNQIVLGRFDNKNLALKPGRYVLTGIRLGYRDVRKEIELYPGDDDSMTFNVQCDQPISANLQEKKNGSA